MIEIVLNGGITEEEFVCSKRIAIAAEWYSRTIEIVLNGDITLYRDRKKSFKVFGVVSFNYNIEEK